MQALAYWCDGAQHVERAGVTTGTADDIELRDALHELLDRLDQWWVGFGQLKCGSAGGAFRGLVAIGEQAVMADEASRRHCRQAKNAPP